MNASRQRGFSFIELVISLGVLAILLGVGVPSFLTFLQNNQTRTAAEALTNGLQVARNEAIRRNLRVQLKMVGGSGWQVLMADDPAAAMIQGREHADGSPNVTATYFPAAADTVTFNSLGRVVPNPDGSTTLNRVYFENTAVASTEARPLNVLIPQAGGVRMCDPRVAATDPRACPATFP